MPETILEIAKALVPNPAESAVAVSPPGHADGFWAGGSSAVWTGEGMYMAYRVRGPLGQGRGFGLVIAKSIDGVKFETIGQIAKTEMNAQSLERPALVKTPDGKWRLYVSCATRASKHWWISMIEANDPSEFRAKDALSVVPGGTKFGIKDPVVQFARDKWLIWATYHPLDVIDQEDRMETRLGTSSDGVRWDWSGTVLRGRNGKWDSRGARVTAVRTAGRETLAFYDGRASKEENFEERTGLAIGTPAHLEPQGDGPIAEAAGHQALRYLDIVEMGDGSVRLYYELHQPDGSHDLRTELRRLPD